MLYDDCIFFASSSKELLGNVNYALHLFDSLGLTIHMSKSFLIPTQVVNFLGVILDSVNMTITLPEGKIDGIRDLGQSLLRRNVSSFHDLASFIGHVVFAGIADPQAPLRYQYLEICRNMALVQSRGDYKVEACLDEHARDQLLDG